MRYIDKILSLLFILIITIFVPFVVPISIVFNTLQDLYNNIKYALHTTKLVYINFYKDLKNDYEN